LDHDKYETGAIHDLNIINNPIHGYNVKPQLETIKSPKTL